MRRYETTPVYTASTTADLIIFFASSDYYYNYIKKGRMMLRNNEKFAFKIFLHAFKREIEKNDHLRVFVYQKFKGIKIQSIDSFKYEIIRSNAENNKQVYIKISLTENDFTCLYIEKLLDQFPSIVELKGGHKCINY